MAELSLKSVGLLLASILGSASPGNATEEPRYKVESGSGPIEIRDYAPMVIAEVQVSGNREAAIQQGFRTLAGYIFGKNDPKSKIAMTTPVTQEPGQAGGAQGGQTIAMTAPVTQEPGKASTWIVRFGMPEGSTLANLPKPLDSAIRLREVPGRRIAAIRFSGLYTEEAFADQQRKLDGFIRERQLQKVGPPSFAFYDPPWTPFFLRRTEILQPVAR
jgi:effector-binding domain-containing protein